MPRDQILDQHILSIIHANLVKEQIDLQEKLKERGLDVPQATLSRRLKKLNIAKVSGVYKLIGAHSGMLPLVLNVQVSEFGMIVLHTHPGSANALGLYLDQQYVSFSQDETSSLGLLGTIAGDDTVLLIIQSKENVKHVLAMLREEFPYLKL